MNNPPQLESLRARDVKSCLDQGFLLAAHCREFEFRRVALLLSSSVWQCFFLFSTFLSFLFYALEFISNLFVL